MLVEFPVGKFVWKLYRHYAARYKDDLSLGANKRYVVWSYVDAFLIELYSGGRFPYTFYLILCGLVSR